ncbi:response regulator [Desulfobotulus mexicanus]|uniref:histidine kinase n=2 Tax=Desulfobotulus mexicanus TaxID=2586642 RepID=A0A5Q4VD79_9BACT|nr:response regulator [Desulfobotulus mexicanus]
MKNCFSHSQVLDFFYLQAYSYGLTMSFYDIRIFNAYSPNIILYGTMMILSLFSKFTLRSKIMLLMIFGISATSGTTTLFFLFHNKYPAFCPITLLTVHVLVFFLFLYLTHILLRPLMNIVLDIRKMRQTGNYSRPLPIPGNREASLLAEGFNHLILEIQEKDKALFQHRATLQQKIMDRTLSLMAANTTLTRLNMKLQEMQERDINLSRHKKKLEEKVVERTLALTKTNARLANLNKEHLEAKKRADDASFAKSAFLASMSHELRTPLNGILGYAQLLHRDGERLGPKDQERIQVIQQCGEHLLRMINDILDLSKIEAGKMDLTLQAFNLASFIKSTAGMAGNRAKEKGLLMKVSMADDLPPTVIGDEHRLRQVLLNLLGNAVKFTEKGYVHLSVKIKNGLISFNVSDTGIGIPEKDLPFIFKPFSQVESIRKKPEGTGLGLAISQYLIRMMGGIIEVKSQLEKGSQFSFAILLPESMQNINTEKKISLSGALMGYRRTDKNTAPLRILIVDDVRENRSFLADFFSPLGFIMDEAESGEQAIEICESMPPDIILMDLIMPGMDGFETTETILELLGKDAPPVIAVSASATPDVREKCMTLGCAAFISKPVQMQRLFEVLCKHLPMIWISETNSETDTLIPEILFPDETKIQELMDLVKQGDISAITEWCQSNNMCTQYKAFTGYVEELAGQFRIRELSRWLNHHGKIQKDVANQP